MWKTNRAPYIILQSASCLQNGFWRRLGTQKMLQSSVQPKAGPEAITPKASFGSPSSGFLPQVKLMLTCQQTSAPCKLQGWLFASNTGFKRFPFDNFTYCLTLFSKFFSSFPHGTCSLSVSRQYLALDGIYHPFWSAFPNKPTLGKRIT